ncbi:MAG: hypothetical protein H0W72_04625 [Planctomycetes bacterium]|nr:hypothetical protein [Planctomycetota bacterium]
MPSPQPTRRAPRSSSGGFWFFLTLVVVAIGAVCIYAPDVPRKMFGIAEKPAPGSEPSTAVDSKTELKEGEHELANTLNDVSTVARTEPKVATVAAPTKPVEKPVAAKYAQETQAQQILTKAETAYKAYKWDAAVSSARQVVDLDAKPATKVRAKDIIRGADALGRLFRELDDRDELARNYDTHPSLVEIVDGPRSSYAVPILGMDNQTVTPGDPVAAMEAMRRTGKVTVLLQSAKSFMAASLPSDQVGQVKAADLAAIRAEREESFQARLARLKNGAMAGNALAWYDAAKFAYQNRLDDHVTAMMDRAIVLDPLLAKSVREDKAAGLFANVVLHLNNKNQKQADAFIVILDRKFSDTPSGQEARAFYDSKSKTNADDIATAQAKLREARKAGERRAREEAEQRKSERIARAKDLGDDAALKEAETDAIEEPDVEMATKVSGDEGKADELFAKGRDLYQKAQEAGNSPQRDSLYGESNKYLSQAQNLYNQLLEKSPGNSSLEEKGFICNKLRYGSIKQRRFH